MKKNYLSLICFALCALLLFTGCEDPQKNALPENPNEEVDPDLDQDQDGNSEGEDPYSTEIIELFRNMQEYPEVPSSYYIGDQVTTDSTYYGKHVEICNNASYEIEASKVVKSKSYSIVENAHEYVTLNPWSALFPGALVAGNQLSGGTVPTVIPIYEKRKPNSIYLAMVAGGDVSIVRDSVEMKSSSAFTAMNEILSDYYDSCDSAGFVAYHAFNMQEVQSLEQLAFHLGVDLEANKVKLATSLSDFSQKEYNYVAVRLNQIFFTMAADAPDMGYRGIFTPDIKSYELADYGISATNPLCYVKSVSYGRSYAMVYKSTTSADSLHAAVNLAFQIGIGATLDADANHIQTFNESEVSVIQIGGDAASGLQAAFGDVASLRSFIIDGAKPSRSNVGAPISYEIAYVHSNANVVNTTTTEYSIDETIYVPIDQADVFKMKFFKMTSRYSPSLKNISCYAYFKVNDVYVKYSNDYSRSRIYTNSLATQLSTSETEQAIYSSYVKIPDSEKFEVGDEITVTIDYSYRHNSYYNGRDDSGHKTDTKTLSYMYIADGKWDIQEKDGSYDFNSCEFTLNSVGGTSTHKLNFTTYFRGIELTN